MERRPDVIIQTRGLGSTMRIKIGGVLVLNDPPARARCCSVSMALCLLHSITPILVMARR
jgi:hypothetical protein